MIFFETLWEWIKKAWNWPAKFFYTLFSIFSDDSAPIAWFFSIVVFIYIVIPFLIIGIIAGIINQVNGYSSYDYSDSDNTYTEDDSNNNIWKCDNKKCNTALDRNRTMYALWINTPNGKRYYCSHSCKNEDGYGPEYSNNPLFPR